MRISVVFLFLMMLFSYSEAYSFSRSCYSFEKSPLKVLPKMEYKLPENDKVSLWLKKKGFSEEIIKEWHDDFELPQILVFGRENPVCHAYATEKKNIVPYGGVGGKYPKITSYEWKEDIFQSGEENVYYTIADVDNDGKKELIQMFIGTVSYDSINYNIYDEHYMGDWTVRFLYLDYRNDIEKILQRLKKEPVSPEVLEYYFLKTIPEEMRKDENIEKSREVSEYDGIIIFDWLYKSFLSKAEQTSYVPLHTSVFSYEGNNYLEVFLSDESYDIFGDSFVIEKKGDEYIPLCSFSYMNNLIKDLESIEENFSESEKPFIRTRDFFSKVDEGFLYAFIEHEVRLMNGFSIPILIERVARPYSTYFDDMDAKYYALGGKRQFVLDGIKKRINEIYDIDFYALVEEEKKKEKEKIKNMPVSEELLKLFNKDTEYKKTIDYGNVKKLMEKGADVNATGCSRTPLMSAFVVETDREVIKLLVEKGADLSAKDRYKRTPLIYALEYKADYELIKYLIEKGAEVEPKKHKAKTPLMYALQSKASYEIIKLLIDKGADVKAYDKQIHSVLRYALENRYPYEIIKFLLDVNNDELDYSEQIVLKTALRNGHSYETIKLLIEKGVDIETVHERETVLMTAMENNIPYETVKLLIEKGAKINSKDVLGETPLIYALKNGAGGNVVRLLIEKGADVNAKNRSNKTVLMYAVRKKASPLTLASLIWNGASVWDTLKTEISIEIETLKNILDNMLAY